MARVAPPSDLDLKAVYLDVLAPLRAAIPRFVEIGDGMAQQHRALRTDAKTPRRSNHQELDTAIGRVTIEFTLGLDRAKPRIKTAGQRTATGNAKKIVKQTEAGGLRPERWLNPAIDAFATANANKIKSIGQEHLGTVSQLVTNAALRGDSATKLAKTLQNQFGVTKDKAKFLARDQIAKFNAGLTQARAEADGIKKYIWRTSRDERVRPMHRRLEGTTQAFTRPPVVSKDGRRCNPGEDYNCRCTAELILPKAFVPKSPVTPVSKPADTSRILNFTPDGDGPEFENAKTVETAIPESLNTVTETVAQPAPVSNTVPVSKKHIERVHKAVAAVPAPIDVQTASLADLKAHAAKLEASVTELNAATKALAAIQTQQATELAAAREASNALYGGPVRMKVAKRVGFKVTLYGGKEQTFSSLDQAQAYIRKQYAEGIKSAPTLTSPKP